MRVGTTLVGRFLLEEETAAGGWSRVFRARDLEGGATVAVKVLERESPAVADRFARERRILAELSRLSHSHPGIVKYVAHDRTADGELFLVQEWVDGRTLASVLAERGLDLAEAVAVVRGVAEALAVAHQRGIVHRDVKPENILIVGESFDRPKVVDFGIARQEEDGLHLTRTGAILGTPGYMSPEQARGAADIDARADVFALGCTLYECATGSPAFSGQNPNAVRVKILLDVVESPRRRVPEIPEPLAQLTLRMLEKDPELRPADAGAVAVELAALQVPARSGRCPTRHEETPTRPEEQRAFAADLVTVILASPVENRRPERLDLLAAAHGADLELLEGGTIVLRLRGALDRAAQAAAAARCALELAALCQQRVAVVVVTAPTDALSAKIDRGALELERTVVRALFDEGGRGEPDVVVDETTAFLLGDGFDLARGPSGSTVLLRARDDAGLQPG